MVPVVTVARSLSKQGVPMWNLGLGVSVLPRSALCFLVRSGAGVSFLHELPSPLKAHRGDREDTVTCTVQRIL